jgi:hypothetical protein
VCLALRRAARFVNKAALLCALAAIPCTFCHLRDVITAEIIWRGAYNAPRAGRAHYAKLDTSLIPRTSASYARHRSKDALSATAQPYATNANPHII